MISKIKCFFGSHTWGGYNNNICIKCSKVAIGLPKFNSVLPPPKKTENKEFIKKIKGFDHIFIPDGYNENNN
jgi:hypothetical protein